MRAEARFSQNSNPIYSVIDRGIFQQCRQQIIFHILVYSNYSKTAVTRGIPIYYILYIMYIYIYFQECRLYSKTDFRSIPIGLYSSESVMHFRTETKDLLFNFHEFNFRLIISDLHGHVIQTCLHYYIKQITNLDHILTLLYISKSNRLRATFRNQIPTVELGQSM